MESIHFPTRDYFPLYEAPPSKTPFSSHPEKEVILAIPNGKKAFCWFTNHGDDVCFMVPRNFKTQPEWTEVSTSLNTQSPQPYFGTLLSGTLVYPPNHPPTQNQNMEYFIADDIFYYAGISLTKSAFCERLEYLLTFFHQYIPTTPTPPPSSSTRKHLQLVFVNMRGMRETATITPKYRVHHWQLRHLDYVSPYYALTHDFQSTSVAPLTNNPSTAPPTLETQDDLPPSSSRQANTSSTTTKSSKKQWIFQYHYPAYKQKVVFRILPETQCDVYTLYARSNNIHNPSETETDTQLWISCSYAGIFEYNTSQLLNRYCRNQYAQHLDQLEDSDDDDEEEKDKISMTPSYTPQYFECTFSTKFRKWIPQVFLPQCSPERVISMNELAIYAEPSASSSSSFKPRSPQQPPLSYHSKNSPHKYPQPPLKNKPFYKNK